MQIVISEQKNRSKKCNSEIIHSKNINRIFCSKKCAGKNRIWTEEQKNNQSQHRKDNMLNNGIIIIKQLIEINCELCGKSFKRRSRKQRFCGKKCSSEYARSHVDCRIDGLKSANTQQINRRSKNEIYLSELCKLYFKNVLVNENMFNGWDADIILTDEKIAILWNGKWHYEKITEKHSVEQVQNRDKIKIKEIKKMGYIPYIIKDMGRFKKEFVEQEFEKLKKYCAV